jgi:hypothetical protein
MWGVAERWGRRGAGGRSRDGEGREERGEGTNLLFLTTND